jgi:hypothetical protein
VVAGAVIGVGLRAAANAGGPHCGLIGRRPRADIDANKTPHACEW